MTGKLHFEMHGAVATIRLANPPLNVVGFELFKELADRCRQLAADSAVRAVILTGGEDAFSTGADLNEFHAAGPGRMRDVAIEIQQGISSIASLPQPTIAAINGYCIGGGFELALACDLRIASDHAVLGLPETTLGLIPAGGGTQRLARLIGPARAKELIWTGARIGAEQALALGAVDQVVPGPEVLARARQLAELLASRPAKAVQAAKRVVDAGLDGSLQAGLALETEQFTQVLETEDAAIGIRAFLTKTEPAFGHS